MLGSCGVYLLVFVFYVCVCDIQGEDQWALRAQAARTIALICGKYGANYDRDLQASDSETLSRTLPTH